MKTDIVKKWFLLLLSISLGSPIFAETFSVYGIYYNVTGINTVEVTYRGADEYGEDGWMYYSEDELYDGYVYIPESVTYQNITYSVTSIGKDAFAGSKNLSLLSIPKTITSIGNGAFTLCNNLQYIDVAEDNTAFFSESGILYTKSPITIYFVPKAIQGDIVLNDAITEIPSSAFQNCSGVTSIQIPENVTIIKDGAFNSCSNLQEIFFNEKLKTLDVQAFSKCVSLTYVSFPNSLTTIGESVFVDCSSLKTVLLQEGLQSIGKYAFYSCDKIDGISLPSTLLTIGEKAFDGCVSLTELQNKSSLTLVQGSESNGCVAKYASKIDNIQPGQDDQKINYQDSILSLLPLGNSVFRYGYNELSEKDKKTYDYILKTLTSFEANKGSSIYHRLDFDFAGEGIEMDIYSLMYMLERIYRDVPEMYILNTIPRVDQGTYYARILMTYTPESYYNELKEINAICDDIIKAVNPEMSTYEKLKVIHDGLVDVTDYGGMSSAYSGSIKGAFLEKKIVCEGFARAFLYLCQKIDVPCLYVSGSLLTSDNPETWGNHAWNFVQVDGKWYLADVTTDGAFPGVCGYSAFLKGQDYFDANYKLTNVSGGNDNTGNKVYTVLPTLSKNAYDPNEQPNPEIIGFEYIISNSCHGATGEVVQSYSYKFENNDLILSGIVTRTCGGTLETADIVDLGDTIKIPTYSTVVGSLTDCICPFDFEITIPNFNREQCVVVFDGQVINVDRRLDVNIVEANDISVKYSSIMCQICVEFARQSDYVVELYDNQGRLLRKQHVFDLSVQIDVPTTIDACFVRVMEKNNLLQTFSVYTR